MERLSDGKELSLACGIGHCLILEVDNRMAKYRPIEPVYVLDNAGESGWLHVCGGLEAVSRLVGIRWYLCGNGECLSSFATKPGTAHPKFCTSCGAEIDWSTSPTRLVKVCPNCSNHYEMRDKFCEFDGSALQVSEEVSP